MEESTEINHLPNELLQMILVKVFWTPSKGLFLLARVCRRWRRNVEALDPESARFGTPRSWVFRHRLLVEALFPGVNERKLREQIIKLGTTRVLCWRHQVKPNEPLHAELLILAVKLNNLSMLKTLRHLNYTLRDLGREGVFRAVKHRNLKMINLLAESGVPVTSQAFGVAIEAGDRRTIFWLRGGKVSGMGEFHFAPLPWAGFEFHKAVMAGEVTVFHLLSILGASPRSEGVVQLARTLGRKSILDYIKLTNWLPGGES